jgi:hypothetical protein
MAASQLLSMQRWLVLALSFAAGLIFPVPLVSRVLLSSGKAQTLRSSVQQCAKLAIVNRSRLQEAWWKNHGCADMLFANRQHLEAQLPPFQSDSARGGVAVLVPLAFRGFSEHLRALKDPLVGRAKESTPLSIIGHPLSTSLLPALASSRPNRPLAFVAAVPENDPFWDAPTPPPVVVPKRLFDDAAVSSLRQGLEFLWKGSPPSPLCPSQALCERPPVQALFQEFELTVQKACAEWRVPCTFHIERFRVRGNPQTSLLNAAALSECALALRACGAMKVYAVAKRLGASHMLAVDEASTVGKGVRDGELLPAALGWMQELVECAARHQAVVTSPQCHKCSWFGAGAIGHDLVQVEEHLAGTNLLPFPPRLAHWQLTPWLRGVHTGSKGKCDSVTFSLQGTSSSSRADMAEPSPGSDSVLHATLEAAFSVQQSALACADLEEQSNMGLRILNSLQASEFAPLGSASAACTNASVALLQASRRATAAALWRLQRCDDSSLESC